MFIHLQPRYHLKTLQNNFYTYNLLFYHVMEDVRVIRKLQMDDNEVTMATLELWTRSSIRLFFTILLKPLQTITNKKRRKYRNPLDA